MRFSHEMGALGHHFARRYAPAVLDGSGARGWTWVDPGQGAGTVSMWPRPLVRSGSPEVVGADRMKAL